MGSPDDGPPSDALESRAPTPADLALLCRALNAAGARYAVIGGMALLLHRYVRATKGIDLIIDPSAENQARVVLAMDVLPDQAARGMGPTDVADYTVVRIADEFVVDLMAKALVRP